MKDDKAPIKYNEGRQLLFDNSYRGIPFNAIMAIFLAIYLSYKQIPKTPILIWVTMMIIISFFRIIHCKMILSKKLFYKTFNFHLKIFIFLTFLTGLNWTSIYFISIHYTMETQLDIVTLFFGGMSAGATTSLAVYFPAFLTYTLSIFIPVIMYQYYYWDINHFILATSLLTFLVGLSIITKSNQKLFKKTFFLTEQNKILSDKFEVLSITDELTGLYNRRHFIKIINEEYNRAKRNQQSFALISIDIDNFKLLNDNFGHSFGDKFIIYTANYLKNYLRRSNDIIFRLGGDEYIVLILNISEEKTKEICNIIKNKFLKTPNFDYKPQDSDHQKILAKISMSIGIVYVSHKTTTDINQIIEIADQLLYQAKNEGKNRIKYTKIDQE